MRKILFTVLLACSALAHADDASSDERGAAQASYEDFQANYNSLLFSLNAHIAAMESDSADVYEGHQMCVDGNQLANLFQNNPRFAADFDKTYAPDVTFADSLKTWRETAQASKSECAKLKQAYDKLDLSL